MKKSQHNSSTSLFLMEMILALLFLSLCSAACIQIFAAARKNRIQAEQWNQIQALTTSGRSTGRQQWISQTASCSSSGWHTDRQQPDLVLRPFLAELFQR